MKGQDITCAECGKRCRDAGRRMCSACYEAAKPKVTCMDCGEQKRPHKHLPEGTLCSRCWGWRNAVACSRCGKVRPRVNSSAEAPVCAGCWTAARPPVTCSSCGKTRMRGGTTSDGKPLCGHCASKRRALVTCAGCGQLKPPHNRAPSGRGYLCGTCASRQRPAEQCGGCGRMEVVTARADDGSPRCHRCWNAARKEECADCGNLRRPVYRLPDQSALCRACGKRRGDQELCATCGAEGWWETRDAVGRRMCIACWRAQRLPCSRCGTETYVALRWLAGPVCADCVDQGLAAPERCSRCGETRPGVAADGEPPCCPGCAGLRFDYQCAGCGQFTRPLRNGQCDRCQVAAILAGAAPDGVPCELSGFLEETLWDDPARGARWLRSSSVARLFLTLLASPPVTHESLDAATATADHATAERLRYLLVTAGALPSQDPSLDHYHRRVDELLAAIPAASRMAVRRYARWAVTGPLQRRVADGEMPTADLTRWPLDRIRTAARLAAGAGEAGLPLDAVTQSQLDAWTAEAPSTAAALRGFVSWASAHGYMAASLDVPVPPTREVRPAMDDKERLDLASRLLHDDDADPRDRLGAVLILLFGQHATRLTQLKATSVSIDGDGRVHLALGDAPLRLREPLAHLAVTVADAARKAGSPWLFPGMKGPMSSDQLRNRLSKAGLPRLPMARNAALASLAADIPPALLAEKLGLSLSAAVDWSKAVGAARADYAGLRNSKTRKNDLPATSPVREGSPAGT